MAEDSNPRNRFRGCEAVPLPINVQVGRSRFRLGALCNLAVGEVILLDRRIGESFELQSNGVLLARVEPVGSESGTALKVVSIPVGDGGNP